MYRLGDILLFIAMLIILTVGGGVLVNIIPTRSPIVAPSTLISLLFIGIGVSLKKKTQNIGK